MKNQPQAQAATVSGKIAGAEKTSVLLSAVFAAVFGIFMVYGVGFAHSDTLHNAAHDSRHSFSFPCH